MRCVIDIFIHCHLFITENKYSYSYSNSNYPDKQKSQTMRWRNKCSPFQMLPSQMLPVCDTGAVMTREHLGWEHMRHARLKWEHLRRGHLKREHLQCHEPNFLVYYVKQFFMCHECFAKNSIHLYKETVSGYFLFHGFFFFINSAKKD